MPRPPPLTPSPEGSSQSPDPLPPPSFPPILHLPGGPFSSSIHHLGLKKLISKAHNSAAGVQQICTAPFQFAERLSVYGFIVSWCVCEWLGKAPCRPASSLLPHFTLSVGLTTSTPSPPPPGLRSLVESHWPLEWSCLPDQLAQRGSGPGKSPVTHGTRC